MWPTSLLVVTLLTVPLYMRSAAEAHETWGCRVSAGLAAAVSAAAPAARSEGAMQITSKLIPPDGQFPKRETCDGPDTSPPLAWSGAPPETKSFALMLDDPDAPSGTFTHWVLWNLPAAAHELPENLPKTPQLPDGALQGRNDFGNAGYGGPCPPPGKPHRYFFRLYALDNAPALKPGASRGELERAMEGHILARGELRARYGR